MLLKALWAGAQYSYTFKPLLDVLLFTRSLSKTMGYRGQFGLYAYYVVRCKTLSFCEEACVGMAKKKQFLCSYADMVRNQNSLVPLPTCRSVFSCSTTFLPARALCPKGSLHMSLVLQGV